MLRANRPFPLCMRMKDLIIGIAPQGNSSARTKGTLGWKRNGAEAARVRRVYVRVWWGDRCARQWHETKRKCQRKCEVKMCDIRLNPPAPYPLSVDQINHDRECTYQVFLVFTFHKSSSFAGLRKGKHCKLDTMSKITVNTNDFCWSIWSFSPGLCFDYVVLTFLKSFFVYSRQSTTKIWRLDGIWYKWQQRQWRRLVQVLQNKRHRTSHSYQPKRQSFKQVQNLQKRIHLDKIHLVYFVKQLCEIWRNFLICDCCVEKGWRQVVFSTLATLWIISWHNRSHAPSPLEFERTPRESSCIPEDSNRIPGNWLGVERSVTFLQTTALFVGLPGASWQLCCTGEGIVLAYLTGSWIRGA